MADIAVERRPPPSHSAIFSSEPLTHSVTPPLTPPLVPDEDDVDPDQVGMTIDEGSSGSEPSSSGWVDHDHHAAHHAAAGAAVERPSRPAPPPGQGDGYGHDGETPVTTAGECEDRTTIQDPDYSDAGQNPNPSRTAGWQQQQLQQQQQQPASPAPTPSALMIMRREREPSLDESELFSPDNGAARQSGGCGTSTDTGWSGGTSTTSHLHVSGSSGHASQTSQGTSASDAAVGDGATGLPHSASQLSVHSTASHGSALNGAAGSRLRSRNHPLLDRPRSSSWASFDDGYGSGGDRSLSAAGGGGDRRRSSFGHHSHHSRGSAKSRRRRREGRERRRREERERKERLVESFRRHYTPPANNGGAAAGSSGSDRPDGAGNGNGRDRTASVSSSSFSQAATVCRSGATPPPPPPAAAPAAAPPGGGDAAAGSPSPQTSSSDSDADVAAQGQEQGEAQGQVSPPASQRSDGEDDQATEGGRPLQPIADPRDSGALQPGGSGHHPPAPAGGPQFEYCGYYGAPPAHGPPLPTLPPQPQPQPYVAPYPPHGAPPPPPRRAYYPYYAPLAHHPQGHALSPPSDSRRSSGSGGGSGERRSRSPRGGRYPPRNLAPPLPPEVSGPTHPTAYGVRLGGAASDDADRRGSHASGGSATPAPSRLGADWRGPARQLAQLAEQVPQGGAAPAGGPRRHTISIDEYDLNQEEHSDFGDDDEEEPLPPRRQADGHPVGNHPAQGGGVPPASAGYHYPDQFGAPAAVPHCVLPPPGYGLPADDLRGAPPQGTMAPPDPSPALDPPRQGDSNDDDDDPPVPLFSAPVDSGVRGEKDELDVVRRGRAPRRCPPPGQTPTPSLPPAPPQSSAGCLTTQSDPGPRSAGGSVGFSTVEIRPYERILGDNPSCSAGPPVSIGWKYDADGVLRLPIDEYELVRCRDYFEPEYGEYGLDLAVLAAADDLGIRPRLDGPDLVLDREEREEMLLSLGYTRGDIADAVRQNVRAKNQRRQTVHNLPVMRFEEMAQGAARKVKKILGRKKGRSSSSLYDEWKAAKGGWRQTEAGVAGGGASGVRKAP